MEGGIDTPPKGPPFSYQGGHGGEGGVEVVECEGGFEGGVADGGGGVVVVGLCVCVCVVCVRVSE